MCVKHPMHDWFRNCLVSTVTMATTTCSDFCSLGSGFKVVRLQATTTRLRMAERPKRIKTLADSGKCLRLDVTLV